MVGDQAVTATVPVSVVVPTLGRAMLRACLASLAAADPRPAEVVVVDQGGAGVGRRLLAGSGLAGRVLELDVRGISRAMNAAMEVVAHDAMLVTHDDCRVRADWVGAAAAALAAAPDALLTGRVLPDGGDPADGRVVPSTIADPEPRVYRTPRADVLYPSNMAARASAVVALGGFDPRFDTAAEDNDLCFRWLAAGAPVRYEPAMVVWHADWRDAQELRALYVRYWEAQGVLHGKHLRIGEPRLLPALGREIAYGARGALHRLARRAAVPDESYGALRGLARGVARGLRAPAAPPALRARR